MAENDRTYYVRRALQEEHAAMGACCQSARDRHRELARAYRALLRNEAIRKQSEIADEAPDVTVHAVHELHLV